MEMTEDQDIAMKKGHKIFLAGWRKLAAPQKGNHSLATHAFYLHSNTSKTAPSRARCLLEILRHRVHRRLHPCPPAPQLLVQRRRRQLQQRPACRTRTRESVRSKHHKSTHAYQTRRAA